MVSHRRFMLMSDPAPVASSASHTCLASGAEIWRVCCRGMVPWLYKLPPRLSPWVVPYSQTISLQLATDNFKPDLYVLMRTMANRGQVRWTLCNATCQLSRLKALHASTKITASVASSSNTCLMAWMAASAPPRNRRLPSKALCFPWDRSSETSQLLFPLFSAGPS